MPNPNSIALDVYLHAKIFHPREEHAQMHAMLLVQPKPTANAQSEVKMRESLIVSFPDTKVDPSFNTAILAGLLHALRELPQDTTLTVHRCSNFLGKALVTDGTNYENNLLGPHYQLIKCVVSALQERSGKVYFKKVDTNPAVGLQNLNPTPTTVDTQSDIMFCTPGILLMEGSQCSFTKIIKSMREKPTRKSTTINLDRIRCCIEEAFQYRPNDSAIWTSIRSNNIHRLNRNFLWKCMHDIFHVGRYWEHVPNLEILGQCQTCGAPESLEHIMLECDASGQRQRDRLLSNRTRFGSLAIKKQLVLDTWSGTLLDEDSLPDDWTRSEEVLVSPNLVKRGLARASFTIASVFSHCPDYRHRPPQSPDFHQIGAKCEYLDFSRPDLNMSAGITQIAAIARHSPAFPSKWYKNANIRFQ
ncbi:hypothetical protein B0H13DRAFT_1933855 [Mycena leptocephala]|nr:hypothetical protein B0H13DRAFT_1933855 [Mycena leptocephala]